MKKILIVSDGTLGHHFVQRVIGAYTTENSYSIIQTKDTVRYTGYDKTYVKFFYFDPTNYYKISSLLKTDFTQAILVMDQSLEMEQTIKNIHLLQPSLRIVALNLWDLPSITGVEWVNMHQIVSLTLLDNLPNIPVIAQNIGLGNGEIMEVLVPFGSSFVYRHIGSIEQNNWKIAALYRNRQLILPSDQRMLQPNDLLVLVGEPTVLKSVYRAIKRELGQFPAPFGSQLYLYINMACDTPKTLMELVRRSIYIQKKLKKPLLIKIINPTHIQTLRRIKSYSTKDVAIEIVYSPLNDPAMLLSDIKKHHIGLCLVSQKMFANEEIREKLYEGKIPILKLANRSFSTLKKSLVMLGEQNHLEPISSTVFDVASQFGFDLELIDYAMEDHEAVASSIEHFKNLSAIFSKQIRLVKTEENPIRFVREYDNFLQCLPFSRKMFYNPLKRLFATDMEILYTKLDAYHQLFIPTQI